MHERRPVFGSTNDVNVVEERKQTLTISEEMLDGTQRLVLPKREGRPRWMTWTHRSCEGHDDGIWETVEALLQSVPGGHEKRQFARALTTLPMRMGGSGMRSATRCAAAACWASWADALPMIGQRNQRSRRWW